MKTITRRFTKPNPYYPHEDGEVVPAAGEVLTLVLSQDARVKQSPLSKIGGGEPQIVEGDNFGRIEIELNENGEIPEGTRIFANDELEPAGTYYDVVGRNSRIRTDFYGEILKIVGEEPINLNALAPEKERPAPIEIKDPVPQPPPLPSKRIPQASYFGFVAGSVYPPEGHYTTTVKATENSYPFHLPFKAVVRRALIEVNRMAGTKRSLRVALRDAATEEKVCEVHLNVHGGGQTETFLDKTLILPEGDYYFLWQADSPDLEVRSIGGNVPMVSFKA